MTSKAQDKQLPEQHPTEDEVLLRMLRTPPSPHKAKPVVTKKATKKKAGMRGALDPAEIQVVRTALREFERRCREFVRLIGNKRFLSPDERSDVERLYRALKDDLKAAKKHGTIDGQRRPQSYLERDFYAPAVAKAHVALKPATNSHPINSCWAAAVFEAQSDFWLYLSRLPGFEDD